MRYFKVYIDYSRHIGIDETELEKALYAFITGEPVIFEMGAATRIESVIPDLNKTLGWNSDYKPTADDMGELEQAKERYTGYIGKVKEKVQYLIQMKRTDLIGKGVDIPELESGIEIPNRQLK